jgi:D-3-phosphoglycerate dehydrogenase
MGRKRLREIRRPAIFFNTGLYILATSNYDTITASESWLFQRVSAILAWILPMSRVVITDAAFPNLDVEEQQLTPLGLRVERGRNRGKTELIDSVRDADFIITQFARMDRDVIFSLRNTRVIVRYGIGVDNIDLSAATERGIPVCNIPDYCIDEVADHTLALMLAATRQVVANSLTVTKATWGLGVPLEQMHCLKSLTVGIVGFGRIGREVVARLRSFRPKVIIFDPGVRPEVIEAGGGRAASLDELFANSDVISLHCPANKSTNHLINVDAISKMKKGVILVNVARGSVVCSESLIAGLQTGQIGFAALDVWESEPIDNNDPLFLFDNVILHSHIASASKEASLRLRTEAAAIVALAAQGKPLRNVVNGVSSPPSYATINV